MTSPLRTCDSAEARAWSRMRARRLGFTLIELAIVVVIIGVLAGVAVPRLANSLRRARVDAAAQRVRADLLLARRAARHDSGSRTITFDVAGGRYTLLGVTDPDRSSAADYLVDLSAAPYESALVSADFGGDASLTYNGYGVPDSGGTVVVQYASHLRYIVVDPSNGEVSISELTSQEPIDVGGGLEIQ